MKFSYIENVCSLATKSRGYQVPVQVEAQSTKVVNYVIIPLKAETIHIEVQVFGSNIRDKVKKSIDVLVCKHALHTITTTNTTTFNNSVIIMF